ncbi:MAG TPA: VOC family protein [Caulobacteraceae bacterium]|jgi:predicted enzyme related to lactoylglutathione lyase
MVQIGNVSPVLLAPDVFETAEYYRDVFGFTFDQIYGEPPSFVIVQRDTARLMFRQPREGSPQPPNATVTPHFPSDVFISVDDVEALADELRSKQADIVAGPTYRPIWNGKELEVRDCNGRTITFGQSMGETSD